MGDASSISYLVVQTGFVVMARASSSLALPSLVPVVGTYAISKEEPVSDRLSRVILYNGTLNLISYIHSVYDDLI